MPGWLSWLNILPLDLSIGHDHRSVRLRPTPDMEPAWDSLQLPLPAPFSGALVLDLSKNELIKFNLKIKLKFQKCHLVWFITIWLKKKTKQNPLVPGVCAGAGCLGAPGAEGRMLQKQFWKVTLWAMLSRVDSVEHSPWRGKLWREFHGQVCLET